MPKAFLIKKFRKRNSLCANIRTVVNDDETGKLVKDDDRGTGLILPEQVHCEDNNCGPIEGKYI